MGNQWPYLLPNLTISHRISPKPNVKVGLHLRETPECHTYVLIHHCQSIFLENHYQSSQFPDFRPTLGPQTPSGGSWKLHWKSAICVASTFPANCPLGAHVMDMGHLT